MLLRGRDLAAGPQSISHSVAIPEGLFLTQVGSGRGVARATAEEGMAAKLLSVHSVHSRIGFNSMNLKNTSKNKLFSLQIAAFLALRATAVNLCSKREGKVFDIMCYPFLKQ